MYLSREEGTGYLRGEAPEHGASAYSDEELLSLNAPVPQLPLVPQVAFQTSCHLLVPGVAQPQGQVCSWFLAMTLHRPHLGT